MAPSNSPASFFSSLSRISFSLFLFLNVVLATPPLVDFDRMGTVGIAGSFAGFTFLDNTTDTSSLDVSTSTLLSRGSDGELSRVGSTNSGGNILAGCSIDDTFYFAGSFSSIGSTSVNNVASYKPSSGAVAALGSNGPNGEVRALFCDTNAKKVWAGGSFRSPAPLVAVWDVASSSWSAPPFGGLSGSGAEVSSITANSSHSSLFFAGSFVTSFGNGSVIVGNNNPNVPFSSGATPFSSSLVPVPLQNAQIEGSPSTSQSGFDKISNILCPAGEDGSGNTWFARDGSRPVITVRKFSYLSASGVRIGNTFLDGRGTTAFSLTTIPDNTIQTLHYTDPTDGQNKTCSDSCPLLSDPNVPYQDFLFNNAVVITGFQLTLTEWKGASAGLHLLQLLSSGAFASSIESNNGVSCFAPSPSNATQTGTWTEKDANTNIPGTIQAVLVSSVDVGTSASQSPTFTWMPYVSASGQYDVSLLVPGCTNFQDCALRTSVKVTLFPGDGLDPIIQTVSQTNTQDAQVKLYSGPVVPSSPSFGMTITMTLADNPEGTGQNGKYELVADRVQLVLTSANVTADGNATTNNSSAGSQRGFGFFEWPLSSSSSVNASGVVPTSSITGLDNIGFQMFNAVGGASATAQIKAVAHHDSGVVFLGGTFNLSAGSASGAVNIVAFKDGQLTALSNKGLNGPVTSLVVSGDSLFVGGSFTDTASASNSALSGVAIYDVKNNQWKAMEGGVNGAALGLSLSKDQLTVVGNFTQPLISQNQPLSNVASSFAIWSTSSSSWSNTTGMALGNLTFVAPSSSSSDDTSEFMAGHISASFEFGASGFALLANNGNEGIPKVTSLSLPLGTTTSTTTPTVTRRGHLRRTAAAIIPRIGQFFKRQSVSSASLTPLPESIPASAPAILAGAFWTKDKTRAVVGGNFSFTTSSGQNALNIALYDLESGEISALKGNQVNGSVQTMLIQGDTLFLGGTFTIEGTNQVSFAVYDLAGEQWDITGVQPLSSGSSSPVTVRTISLSPSQTNTIIVAGSFASAGSTSCKAICQYQFEDKAWSALGSGIQGEVASVAYAGTTLDHVVASGSIALADGTLTNVAMYTIANQTWSTVGNSNSLPGPVTAVEVNNGNSSSIFAAGKSSDGSQSYLSYWDGHTWNELNPGFADSTDVSQLVMVPLQNTHDANGVIETDRMLMVSGTISGPSLGNASSVLFDGKDFIPYILSSSSTGTPGAVSSLIHSISRIDFTQRHFLAVGIVILISIAIAAGVVFLLALIGILWTLFSRRDDRVNKFDPAEIQDDESAHRPTSLLEHINAATRNTILGGHDIYNSDNMEKEVGTGVALNSAASEHDPFGPDASNYQRAETPSDAIVGMSGMSEDISRSAHARYSFDGQSEGELPMSAGQEIEVLDDRDAAWWYARDPKTGLEGVVPAAYVY